MARPTVITPAVVAKLKDGTLALKYLERKRREEFSLRCWEVKPERIIPSIDVLEEARRRARKFSQPPKDVCMS